MKCLTPRVLHSSTLKRIIYSQRQRLLIRGLLAVFYTYVHAATNSTTRPGLVLAGRAAPTGHGARTYGVPRCSRQRPARGRRRHGAVLAAAGAEDVAFAVSVCVSRARRGGEGPCMMRLRPRLDILSDGAG